MPNYATSAGDHLMALIEMNTRHQGLGGIQRKHGAQEMTRESATTVHSRTPRSRKIDPTTEHGRRAR